MDLQINAYSKAYVEILEIIRYMGPIYRKKIPSKLLNFFEKNKDASYKYKLDYLNSNSSFLKETIILLALIEQKYWASNKELEILNQVLNENEKKYQKNLKEKYSADNLFANNLSKENTYENCVAVIKYKESIFTKIKNWLKQIFK